MTRYRSWRGLRISLLAVALAGLVAAGSGCRERDVERTLGDLSVASIEAAYDVDRDPLINQWLDHAGQTLVGHSARQDIPYSFKVIETEQVNAFAAPYGHIYVTRGFLDFVDTEDEVWMILGHEIGHIVHRDSITSFKQSLLWGILTQIIRGESDTIGDVVGVGLGLLSLQYSRDDEYRADDAGTLLSHRAGYDPHKGIEFFHRLAARSDRRPARWEVYFMTHPPTHRRIERQMQREEFDRENPEALVQTASGYLRRGQPAIAAMLLHRTLELEPQMKLTHSILGDAHAMRGEIAAAERAYRAALEAEDDRSYARTRLAALPEAVTRSAPIGIGATGRAAAADLAPQVREARAMLGGIRSDHLSFKQQTEPRVAALGSDVVSINNRLLDLANYQGNVTRDTQQLVVRGNAAISRATEAAYVLERVSESIEQSSLEAAELLAECEAALADAEAGHGNPEDIHALRTAIGELKHAAATLELAIAEAPQTLDSVESAQSSARDVTSLMEMVVQRDDPRGLLADQLRAASTTAQQRGVNALQAVNRAKLRSVQARGHALVARLNLLGTAASPAMQSVFDAQVSHLLLVPESRVRALRATGAGYGETAMALAASRSARTDPGPFLPSVTAGISPVSEALRHEAAVHNANTLLKFLAASMEAEREAELEL